MASEGAHGVADRKSCDHVSWKSKELKGAEILISAIGTTRVSGRIVALLRPQHPDSLHPFQLPGSFFFPADEKQRPEVNK